MTNSKKINRICPQTFAVVDSQRQDPGDPIDAGIETFRQNCQALQIDCLVLERRAIENYLPDHAISIPPSREPDTDRWGHLKAEKE